ncbi:MAG TPA: hypothetical protein VLX31_11765, partial [Streptosporangiaceae bacterium]|nr:hypothetical protein [Streptosporangiaceae bacterium]
SSLPNSERIQVSASQWALLSRVNRGTTPRDLAWELGRSVFGTTTDAHRLILLGLLSADSRPADRRPADHRPASRPHRADERRQT